MKVLFIQREKTTNTGGFHITERNFRILQEKYGAANVERLMVSGRKINVDAQVRKSGCDMVFLDSSVTCILGRKIASEYKTEVFFHNVERKYMCDDYRREYKSGTKKNFISMLKSLLRLAVFCHVERVNAVRADRIITMNERDSKELQRLYGRSADYIWPTSFADSFKPYEGMADTGEYLLFVGFDFFGNTEGLFWFIDNCMPRINMSLVVVGKGMDKYSDRNSDKVTFHGFVDDLASYYRNAFAVVSPIVSGSGMKTKTCEALMYGKVMFGTDEAFEGYGDVEKCGCIRCNTADEFVNSINSMADEKVPKCSEEVREHFQSNFSDEAVVTAAVRGVKILFNANIFAGYAEDNSNRSGIFFAASDLLSELYGRKGAQIDFYCDFIYYLRVRKFIEKFYPDAKLYTDNSGVLRSAIVNRFDFSKRRSFPGRCVSLGLRKILAVANRLSYASDMRRYEEYDAAFTVGDPFPSRIHNSDKIATVTTIHDLIPYVIREFDLNEDYWLFRIFKARRKSDHYVCISENTKKDMLAKFPDIREDQVFVNYNGLSDRFYVPSSEESDRVLRKYGLKKDGYMFSMGNTVPHKNLPMQIKAYIAFAEQTDTNGFVYAIAGGSLVGRSDEFVPAEAGDKVKLLGYVPDEDVPALYANALFCSFTTLYEGFGFPALEAMKCGCPLVASNTSSLPEVCGDAAVLVDPNSLEEHVAAYSRMYNEAELRESLRAKGFAQADRFRWSVNVDRLLEHLYNIGII